MFTLLNLIVFFVLSWYAVKLMFSTPSYVKLSKTERVLLSGREKFLLLTIATGMIQIGVDLGMSLSAFRLMFWIGLILLAFLLYRRTPDFRGIVMIYALFLLWLAFSLLWTVDIGYGIRAYLKYLYPFLIMLFAATFVRSPDFIFVAMRWMIITSFVLSLFLGGFMTHLIGLWYFYGEGLFWPMSTLADYLAIMSGVSFVMWWRTGEKKYLFLIGWFFLSAVLQSVRTGLLSILMVVTVASYIRYKQYSLPYIGAIVFVAIASVVFIPQVREKMFNESAKVEQISDLSSISTDNIDSNARFAMWEWAMNKFYEPNKWSGSGLGSVQQYMYDNYVFGGLHVLHNDYVQILSDTGVPGLILYALFPIGLFVYAWKPLHRRELNTFTIIISMAVLSYIAVLTAMMTDNVVNYAFAAHSYPFIFIGIALAYKRIEKLQRRTY